MYNIPFSNKNNNNDDDVNTMRERIIKPYEKGGPSYAHNTYTYTTTRGISH